MALGRGQMLPAGQIIGGHYRIIKHLGSGNFGETYQAEDSHAMNRKCVVKRLSFVSNNQAIFNKARELFEREASVLLKLNESQSNGQIPRFFAYFDENQEFYLVQELIDGHPLSDELRGGRKLSEEQVVELLEDVLRVLKFIHSQGIIHRDLKPENIMRRVGDGKLILIDFGAVKEVLTQSVNGRARTRGTMIYTEGYAPREQLQGEPRPNSDIYALGMTAIQALTGYAPADLPKHPDKEQVIWRNQVQVSNKLAEILDKMVQQDWQRRYQSAGEVLQGVQKLKGTVVRSPAQPKSILATQPPLPLGFAIIAAIVMIVAFAALLSFFPKREALIQQKSPESPTPASKPEQKSPESLTPASKPEQKSPESPTPASKPEQKSPESPTPASNPQPSPDPSDDDIIFKRPRGKP